LPPQSKLPPQATLSPQSKIASSEQVFKKDLSNACKKKLPPQSKFSKKTCPMHVYNIKLDD